MRGRKKEWMAVESVPDEFLYDEAGIQIPPCLREPLADDRRPETEDLPSMVGAFPNWVDVRRADVLLSASGWHDLS